MRKDRREWVRTASKLYPFAGKTGGLKCGEKYSLQHMADIAGINSKTLHSRMRAKQCKIVTDYDLRVARAAYNNDQDKPFESRLETPLQMLSQKWLSRRWI